MPRYFHAGAALEAKSMKLAGAVTTQGAQQPSVANLRSTLLVELLLPDQCGASTKS
jgi:hypothetical protein